MFNDYFYGSQSESFSFYRIPRELIKGERFKSLSTSSAQERRDRGLKVVLSGDRLHKYYPDDSITPKEIAESIYTILEEHSQSLEKKKKASSKSNISLDK